MTSKNKPKKGTKCLAERDGLIDLATLDGKIEALIAEFGDATSPQCRNALLAYLKQVIADGRDRGEVLLLEDGSGLKCAARLSSLQDELIGAIHRFVLKHIYRIDNPSAAERMAIVAVGGYGRGTLAPGSDIDLLFLLPYKQTPWGESVVEYILYMLWDMSFKVGHATRNLDECIRLSLQDMTIRTAVLEARFLHGDKDLFDDMEERFSKEVIRGTSAKFIEAKMAERDQRHSRAGGSRYLVEPNLKEGKGALRDLHTLFWISKYFYQVKTADELLKEGIFNKDEYKLFRKSGDFLWAVRCHLHYLTGRAEERLSFDLQREMAKRLNYKTHGGLLDVERFMKHYFLVAKNVGDLTNILSTKLEQNQVKKAPKLNRLVAAIRGRKPSAIKGNDVFLIENNRIIQTNDDIFKKDPVNFLRAFKTADRTGLNFHPNLLHLMARSLKLITKEVRANREANDIFLEVLCSKRDPETILRKMNESGVLGRFVPDFGKIIAMMQFNMYHHYTVDEHTIRAIGVLSSIEHKESEDEHPVAHNLFDTLDDRRMLYIALFLHDIAKGRPEDHSIAGAKVAKRIGKRFNLKPSQIETLSWLVLEHLTMSIIAQSRDLSDPKTIRDFANIVQSPERLKLLLILTICDIKAVGPGVWNGWKGQLLRTLYHETQPLLAGGYNTIAIEKRMEEARGALAKALTGWDEADRIAYVERHYPAYLLRTDLETQKQHAEFILKSQTGDMPLATMAHTLAFEGVTEITIYAPDQPDMLRVLAGACARAGAHIVDAQIYTTRDGFAIDTMHVRREFDKEEDEIRRAERIGDEIRNSLAGIKPKTENGISLRSVQQSSKAFSVQTEIVIDNTLSNRFSVIEASGKDRKGLLHDLAHAIFGLSLNISSAHIATFGERAVDVFYVTDLMGEKITNKARQGKIKRHLEKAFTPPAKPKKKVA
ncbi:MAG: [protein-PII] uridylyltransferase [Hyphomicrobiales bacterium]